MCDSYFALDKGVTGHQNVCKQMKIRLFLSLFFLRKKNILCSIELELFIKILIHVYKCFKLAAGCFYLRFLKAL